METTKLRHQHVPSRGMKIAACSAHWDLAFLPLPWPQQSSQSPPADLVYLHTYLPRLCSVRFQLLMLSLHLTVY